MKIGYARVSTTDQNLDMQRDALARAGCDKIFEEKKSGKAGSKRPELESALAYLRPEDVLVVWKLDRLGRSLVEMMRTIDKLRADGVKFRSLTEELDSESAQGRFFLQIHGAMGISSDTPIADAFVLNRYLRLADGPDEVHMSQLGKLKIAEFCAFEDGQIPARRSAS